MSKRHDPRMTCVVLSVWALLLLQAGPYLVRNFGEGVEDVAVRLKPLLDDSSAQQAIEYLKEDFQHHDGTGPRRVAEFITGGPDDTIQADVVGFIGLLRDLCVK